MIAISIKTAVEYLWSALGLYFVVGAIATRRPRQNESPHTRILRLAAAGAAGVLVFWHTPALAILHKRIFPDNSSVRMAGLVFTAAGLLLTALARFYLGQFWSASVVVKDSHQLIRKGPYAFLRHPIYTGILTALVGTEMVYGQWRFILMFVTTAAIFWYKALAEEALLAKEFGPEFEEHKRHTGFLLPRLHPQ